MGQLDGKIAVVTGASSGSGLGIARRFTQEGATVFMLARGKERLEEAAAPLGDGAIPVATDLGARRRSRSAMTSRRRSCRPLTSRSTSSSTSKRPGAVPAPP